MILPRRAELRLEKVTAMLILAVLIAGFAVSDRMQRWAETAGYEEPAVYAELTPFQRIVFTRSGKDLRLFLNGNLHFPSRDEYHYNEAMVHTAPGRDAVTPAVLVMCVGHGLADRKVLEHPGA